MAGINFGLLDLTLPSRLAAIPQQQEAQNAQNAMQFMQLQQTMQQNALAKSKMEEYTRGTAEKNALRGRMTQPGFDIYDPKHQAEIMGLSPELAPGIIKHALDVKTAESTTNKNLAQTESARLAAIKTENDFINDFKRSVAINPSNANIIAFGEDAVLRGIFSPEKVKQVTKRMLDTPVEERPAMFARAGAPAAAPQQPRQPNLAADLLIPDPNNPGNMIPNKALIAVKKDLRPLGTTVNVSTDKAYGGVVAAGAAKQDLEQINRAQTIPQDFAKIDETLNILKKTDINTGLGADLFTVLDKARAQVTADKKAGTRAVNTEYLDSLLGSAVFPQIQALGIGARGMDTPAEREFLRKVMTGSIGLTKDTLIKMTELRRKGLENESTLFNKRVEKGEFKPYEEAARRKVEAVTVPPLPTSAPKGTVRPTGVGSDWTLMTDAKGNSAWVSPDRKSFEEAK